MPNKENRPLTWDEIKVLYPELAAKLKAGDIPSRIEFIKLSFNADIIEN